VPCTALPAQTDQSGTEVFRQERVEDRIEAAVGVGETVRRQSYGDERGRDEGLVASGGEVLDYEDHVHRQPARAERRHDDHHQPRHPASCPRRLRRPEALNGTMSARPAAATHVVTAQQPEDHASVEDTDEGHRKDEGEGEERAVEDSTVVRVVGHQTNVEAC